jgi:hypothetical protein
LRIIKTSFLISTLRLFNYFVQVARHGQLSGVRNEVGPIFETIGRRRKVGRRARELFGKKRATADQSRGTSVSKILPTLLSLALEGVIGNAFYLKL